jgi:hypothetical protein
MVKHHLHNRANLRTGGGMVANPWLFPGYHPGKHLDPQSIMMRLRKLGINLLGARNSALQDLVAEVPPPLVAELLGNSHQVSQRHAETRRNRGPDTSRSLANSRCPTPYSVSGPLGLMRSNRPEAASPPPASLIVQRSKDEYGGIEYGGLPVKPIVFRIIVWLSRSHG